MNGIKVWIPLPDLQVKQINWSERWKQWLAAKQVKCDLQAKQVKGDLRAAKQVKGLKKMKPLILHFAVGATASQTNQAGLYSKQPHWPVLFWSSCIKSNVRTKCISIPTLRLNIRSRSRQQVKKTVKTRLPAMSQFINRSVCNELSKRNV